MSRSKAGWLAAGLFIIIFLALMFLILSNANANDVFLFIQQVEPDALINLYFDGRTVRV